MNTVDSTTLVELPQIGPYTAVRIIEFREKLGGFVDKEQLRDVKGMDDARFAAIQPYINLGAVEIRKVDVNRADFKTLVHHPYLSYEQVKRIVNQREKRGMIKNWTQLEALLKEEGEVNPLLEQYVKYQWFFQLCIRETRVFIALKKSCFFPAKSLIVIKNGIFATDFWKNCHKSVMKTIEIIIK